MAIDSSYLKYCVSDREKDIISSYLSTNSQRETAKDLSVGKGTVQRAIKSVTDRASLQGYAPDNDMVHTAPDTHFVKGTSTLYKDGKPSIQWVKTSVSMKEQEAVMMSMVEALSESVEPKEPRQIKELNFDTDIIPWFQIGDAHIGMLAHHEEVGHDFDLKIAESELFFALKTMIDRSPDCERAVIQDCGDATHYFNMEGRTQSGHDLDYDTRFHKMIKVYTRLLENIIDYALTKFKYVDVIINQGNHSRTNDFWAAYFLRALYKNDDRLTVLDNTNIFIPYRMGNTFVMTHHSDKCKPPQLASVMATDYAEDWGESKYRYIDIGHIHHRSVAKELAGVTVESWNQLAPADKYAHEGGWRSRSCLTCVLRSKTYGEVGRFTLPVEEVKDRLNGLDFGDTSKARKKVYSV